jgi:hypothetical protein
MSDDAGTVCAVDRNLDELLKLGFSELGVRARWDLADDGHAWTGRRRRRSKGPLKRIVRWCVVSHRATPEQDVNINTTDRKERQS